MVVVSLIDDYILSRLLLPSWRRTSRSWVSDISFNLDADAPFELDSRFNLVPVLHSFDFRLGAALRWVPFDVAIEQALELLVLLDLQDASATHGAVLINLDPLGAAIGAETMFAGVQSYGRDHQFHAGGAFEVELQLGILLLLGC